MAPGASVARLPQSTELAADGSAAFAIDDGTTHAARHRVSWRNARRDVSPEARAGSEVNAEGCCGGAGVRK
jgi:hypothetical protein